ncbi:MULTISPECIES: hypothetical protein [Frankia]|uniref:CRISPR-associated protein n=1 Tax=Frankia alni (strain DSM 45986 / CECT 9034 / ACN14a) TaxID=326424 RepID=Q0RE99_FRAAA|nr:MULTISPECIES: hypothetical protein [Frankia]CAJ64212.1 Hypothetical protein FRAAL5579 [Frankia alni ACN14a]
MAAARVSASRVNEHLFLTEHPLQRSGARSITLLAEREDVDQVTSADLDRVAKHVVSDVVDAAVADKTGAAYDWWKILFAMYPNAKPTHAKRRRDRDELTAEVARYFAPDVAASETAGSEAAGGEVRPCAFCGGATTVLWAKSTLPMFDTTKALNTLPPRLAGWPVCRPCRLALWAMPYGASVTLGSATVLTCENAEIERRFTEANLARSARIRQTGFSSLAANASPESVVLLALEQYAVVRPVAATLWSFKNDNQEPWLRVSETRIAVVTFLRALGGDGEAKKGWWVLRRRLTRRGPDGKISQHGRDLLARALFASTNSRSDRILSHLSEQAGDLSKISGSTIRAWRALHALYLKEMHGVDTADLRPVTTLLTDWIMQEKNPRGRFNEYCRAANRSYVLQRLLMEATARLWLDGRRPADITKTAQPLLHGPQGYQWRGQLFFEVSAELDRRGAAIGKKSDDEADAIEPDGPLFGTDPADPDDEGA